MNHGWMDIALEEARKAASEGEVPVGAVVVDAVHQTLVSKARNRMIHLNNPLAHAEMLALQEAFKITGQSRLHTFNLYVTLEPCPMCAQAISFSRIQQLFFGAYDVKGGGVDHGPQIFESSSCFHRPQVWGGIQAQKSQRLLKDFFNHLR